MTGADGTILGEAAVTDLSKREIEALSEALEDEYHAWATYDQVVQDFGDIRPFNNIRESEARHIGALQKLFVRCRIPVPDNHWRGKVPRYDSLREACLAGVKAEIANGERYDRLMASTSRPDLRPVFSHLQAASQHRHLPAFRRCSHGAAGDTADGRPRRRRHGRGRK